MGNVNVRLGCALLSNPISPFRSAKKYGLLPCLCLTVFLERGILGFTESVGVDLV